MIIYANGKPIFTETIQEYIKREIGINKAVEYFEREKAKYKPVKEFNK